MRPFNPAKATTEELVDYFAELGLLQEQAEIMSNQSKINRVVRRRFEVVKELKSRDGDALRLLIRYYDHQCAQVRLNAATATLALFPEAARRKIQEIAEWEAGPVALEASMRLHALDEGIFHPV
ncbi:DUF2019 domain-containing protein [Consotaella salsifontis]|uniref:DUF2019 domain-containing protein n=1 Tax=Consotaella salsifontis TaxID=1365950 RepID=A0A1T4SR54_9HYPH|nr:DUF2019 domain-containing protein [Consotaella salsifontis]SKA30709.1 protein of unknown function [Consotaella salsifontis]